DGTSGSSFSAITGVNGDTFTLTGAGTTSGKNVNGGTAYTGTGSTGTGQGFNLGTLGLVAVGGANANNYTLVGGTDSYTLVPKVLNLTGTRTYDGTTTIYSDGTSGSSFSAITGVNGDTFTLTGAGTTSGKNVNGGTAYTGTG
ncbi:hypothetical protein WHJ69_14470, partial [Staphylococcus aureus]|uniref:hypothetical protein n=1 Tax=Staphylococcus aureus TaxID=1280 RepID=UPI0039BE4C59